MTLRGRLTAAFLAAVLGPVLLGAFFVGSAVTAVSAERATEQLDRAVTAVATSVSALCRQLSAAATAVAIVGDPSSRRAAADRVVATGLGTTVRVTAADGGTVLTTSDAPPRPWLDCAGGLTGHDGRTATGVPAADGSPPTGQASTLATDPATDPASAVDGVAPTAGAAIAARVRMRDDEGAMLGDVTVASVLDEAFVDRLAAAAGASITLLSDISGDAAAGGPGRVRSTEPAATRAEVLRAAASLDAGDTVRLGDGSRYVRRIAPSRDQPLPLVLTVPGRSPQGLYAVLAAVVVLTGVFVVVMAWWLARSTTRPLAELAGAADRVASGDLAARVPLRGQDEVGRLAATFNRMTRETQAYVQALTASRDQLRGHLAVLGDTLSSTHDLGRILHVILQTALAATGARAGVVLLRDPVTSTLVAQCAEGLGERWPAHDGVAATASAGDDPVAGPAGGPARADRDPAGLRVPVGSGLLGSVADTGIPLRGHVERDGITLSEHEPRCRTYVAVPFLIPSRIGAEPIGIGEPATSSALGVLALYDRLGVDEFDDSDVTTLRNFAGQAAVAVDNVRAHQEAQRLSLTDPLTGLWNYRYLQESVRREVERASRFQRMLTVLALDLDHFKEVNDRYGHAAGDVVLAEFARRIRVGLREVDLAFRQGGEEFVVLLPETDQAGGEVVAERLGEMVRGEPVHVRPHQCAEADGDGWRVPITVSIGVAVYPDHATTAPRILEAADDALYAAKAAGRDTYRVAGPDRSPEVRELEVRAADRSPVDGLPRAGGAPRGPRPPRQSHGR